MDNCNCEICKNNLPFEIPNELIESLLDGELVLFAGAGISTETKSIFKETLYEDIYADLKLDGQDISFPDLMSKYVKTNTNGRQKLLEKIRFRFDYCQQFNELFRDASRFHEEICSLWMLKEIITTNWDDYFERVCDAIPIVTPEDFAFYKMDQRKVFKIHGSISNYGSIIATTEDYEKSLEDLKTGVIGANLKMLLTTKTVVFIGYSFRDFDFLEILTFLKSQMKGVLPHIYIVTLDTNVGEILDGFNYTLINTDGTYFFSSIRKHLEGLKYIFPKENLERIYEIGFMRSEIHKFTTNDFYDDHKCSSLIYCAFYQDGIQHALDYLSFKTKRGDAYNPHHIISRLHSYEDHLRKKYLKNKNYQEVAYIDGYIQGLTISLIPEEEWDSNDFPMFYLFGIGPISDPDIFKDAIINNTIYHKTAEKMGKKYFKQVLESEGIVPHHRPFL
jgi:hypothetical protein